MLPSPINPATLERMFRVLQNSNVPMRRPSWNDPTFWSRPLVKTIGIPLNAGTWTDVLQLDGRSGYTAFVNGYTATTLDAAAIAQVRFRLLYNGRFLSTIDFVSDVERNRESATLFPTFPQETFFLIETPRDNLRIQAINDGTFQQMVLCGFFGWYYDNKNQAERGNLEGLTDA